MLIARQAGTSQLQVILVIALILVFTASLLHELQLFLKESEKVQVERVLDGVNQSINSLITKQIARDSMMTLADYDGSNPMRLLALEPAAYRGEYSDADATLQPGSWYFNKTNRQLVYQLRDPAKISNKNDGDSQRIYFRLNLKYRDKNNNQRYDKAIDEVNGLALEPISPYQWRS